MQTIFGLSRLFLDPLGLLYGIVVVEITIRGLYCIFHKQITTAKRKKRGTRKQST